MGKNFLQCLEKGSAHFFFTLIDWISFYFYTSLISPSCVFSPFSLTHSFFFFFSPSSPVTSPSIPLHPLHLFSPLTPVQKRDNGTPCCVMMCACVCVCVCVNMSKLICPLLCPLRLMMPCLCLTKQPTDTEVSTKKLRSIPHTPIHTPINTL